MLFLYNILKYNKYMNDDKHCVFYLRYKMFTQYTKRYEFTVTIIFSINEK